jgi:hypothetical protein
MSLYDDFFGKDFEKEIEAMNEREAIAKFKQEKKEPIIKRRDILLEIIHKRIVEVVKGDINGLDTDDMDSIDKMLEERLDQYEKSIEIINKYYDTKLKEIDDMKLKVVRKERES